LVALSLESESNVVARARTIGQTERGITPRGRRILPHGFKSLKC
jgi:hypothetical protein